MSTNPDTTKMADQSQPQPKPKQTKIMIVCERGRTHEVDLEVAMAIRDIKAELDVISNNGNTELIGAVVSRSHLSYDMMGKVIAWVDHFRRGDDGSMFDGFESWASHFLFTERSILTDLLKVAMDLGVDDLEAALNKSIVKYHPVYQVDQIAPPGPRLY